MAMNRLRTDRIVAVALIAFTVYVLVSLFMINRDIQSRQQEMAVLDVQIGELIATNEDLQKMADQGMVDDEYIIRMAREKLNFVYPDERVFQDMAGN